MMFDVNDLALSETMASTSPKYLKMFSSRACTTVSDLGSLTGISHTNLVKLSLHVRTYSFLLSDLGSFHNDLCTIKPLDNQFCF